MPSTKASRTIIAILLSVCLFGALALTGCGGGGVKAGTAGKVTITVDITAAVDAGDPTAKALAEQKGGNTYKIEIGIDKGDSVLDAAKASGLVVATSSAPGFGDYVTSIDGLAEKAVTAQAGWIFTVNGEMPMTSIDSIEAADGDDIVFTYVTSWE